MKYIHLEWQVNDEMRDVVTNALNEEWEVTFYLHSQGGLWSSAEAIISMINKNSDRVTLVANNYIASNAFNIFFRAKCKREVNEKTEWMAHMARIDTSMSGKRRIQYTPKWQMKNMWNEAKTEAKILKSLWCSKNIIKQFLNEYDVYFNTKKLRKMLNTQVWKT